MSEPAIHDAIPGGPPIRRQAMTRLVTEATGRLLQFALIYSAQRTLGPAIYGELTWALSLGIVLTPLTDLGLQLIVTREIARGRERAAQIAGAALAIKLVAAIATAVLIVAASLTRSPGTRLPAVLIGLSLVAASFVEFAGYLLRGLQRADLESFLLLALRVATVAAGLWMLARGDGLLGLSLAYLFSAVAATALASVVAGSNGIRFVPVIDPALFVRLLRDALPLGIAIVASMAYTRTAVFLLDAMEGASAVGMYGVAQRLVEPLAMIPAALLAAAFPAFTGRHATGRAADASRLGARTVIVLALIGGVLSVAGASAADVIIWSLYGNQYAAAAPVLRWLSYAVWVTFINYALTHGLIAMDRQRLYLAFCVTVFAVNLMLCLVLIPRYGAQGGAMASVASECVLLGLCAWGLSASQPRPNEAL